MVGVWCSSSHLVPIAQPDPGPRREHLQPLDVTSGVDLNVLAHCRFRDPEALGELLVRRQADAPAVGVELDVATLAERVDRALHARTPPRPPEPPQRAEEGVRLEEFPQPHVHRTGRGSG